MAMTRHPSLAVHPGHGPKSEIVENHSVKERAKSAGRTLGFARWRRTATMRSRRSLLPKFWG